MAKMTVQIREQRDEHDCTHLVVTDDLTGKEIFHAEIWNYDRGAGGDIDIFSRERKVTVLEFNQGDTVLRHVALTHHVAVDFREE